jgi:hypothetical protein
MSKKSPALQSQLPIDPAASGYPRNAKGEYGEWQDGACFTPWQVEWHKLEGRHASIEAQLGIVELEDGTWLADLVVWGERFPTREQALQHAVEEVITRVRNLARPRVLPGGTAFLPHLSIEEANAIIKWASSLIGIEAEPVEAIKRTPAWADLPLFQENQRGGRS